MAAMGVLAASLLGGAARAGSGGAGEGGNATGGAGGSETPYLAGCLSDDDCGEQQMCTGKDGALGECVASVPDQSGSSGEDDESGTDEASQSLSAGEWQCAESPASSSSASGTTGTLAIAAALTMLGARLRRGRRGGH